MKPQYLALDLETGGIGVDKSLLTAYFVVLDEQLEILDELDLKVKPNDGNYVVTAEGLAVNKINLVEHDKDAITESKAGQLLYKFLDKNSRSGQIKLVPVGHGVMFDILFVHAHLVGRPNFEQFTSYRKMDTAVVAQFLKLRGEMPDATSGSLESLAHFYELPTPDLHNAKADTLLTIDVLKKMVCKVG